MGWSFRRSMGIGPVRLNVSRSGVGASVGVKGFRVGMNARGRRYMSASAFGLTFRQTSKSRPGRSPVTHTTPGHRQPFQPQIAPTTTGSETHAPYAAHGEAEIGDCADEFATAVKEALERRSVVSLAVLFCIASVVAYLMMTSWGWSMLIASIPGVLGLAWLILAIRDDSKHVIKIDFDLDDECTASWDGLKQTLASLRENAAQIQSAHADVYKPKYHSGASTLVDMKTLQIQDRTHFPFISSNAGVPTIEPVPGTAYCFFPDRILVLQGRDVGVIRYDEISCQCMPSRIVQQSVPRGARVVGNTWEYVNKDGSPDRRFASNRELPIVEYASLQLTSVRGMEHRILVADHSAAMDFVDSLRRMAIPRDVHVEHLEGVGPTIVDHETETVPCDEDLPSTSDDSDPAIACEEESPVAPDDDSTSPDLKTAAFNAMCCVMFADGIASRSERIRIIKIMERVGDWREAATVERITEFCTRWKKEGPKSLVAEAATAVSKIQRPQHQETLKKCLQLVCRADGEVSTSEKAVYSRFVAELG